MMLAGFRRSHISHDYVAYPSLLNFPVDSMSFFQFSFFSPLLVRKWSAIIAKAVNLYFVKFMNFIEDFWGHSRLSGPDVFIAQTTRVWLVKNIWARQITEYGQTNNWISFVWARRMSETHVWPIRTNWWKSLFCPVEKTSEPDKSAMSR